MRKLLSQWEDAQRREFRARLLSWYRAHGRDLPWRHDGDPYRVWISEVMLQQTRVAVVVEYFRRFIRRFPDVVALARARPAEVLAAWSGLGYYRRARALHAAARQIVAEGGCFPQSAAEWERLPGIGRYTAAAVASIAYREACAVVDGNVERVLARLFGAPLSRAEVWERAQELLSRRSPGDFNQALMELGATVCLPAAPRCDVCPVAHLCGRYRQQEPRGNARTPRRKRSIAYRLAMKNGAVLLVRRNDDQRLMPGMWELPEATITRASDAAFRLRHSITTTDYTVLVEQSNQSLAGGKWVARKRLAHLPLTGLARKVLRIARLLD